MLKRLLVTLAAVAATAGCVGTSDGLGDATVFVDGNNIAKCAYITEANKDTFCGSSQVTDKNLWVSPEDNTVYDPADGLTDQELALAKLLTTWPPPLDRLSGNMKLRMEHWVKINPDFAARYATANASAAPSATPTSPAPSPSPTPSKRR